jgi:hypothetical protein
VAETVGRDTVCTLRLPDGSLFARAFRNERHQLYRLEYYAPNGMLQMSIDMDGDVSAVGPFRRFESARPGRVLRPQRTLGCTDTENPSDKKWFSTINWYLNYASIPADIDAPTTEQNMRNAHVEWEVNDNNCGVGDATGLNFSYQGRTSVGVGQNGYNTIGFGPFPIWSCSNGVAGCTITWYNTSSGWPEESDIRLNSNNSWQNGTSRESYRFDVWQVVAHELGHQAQFGHVSDTNQVMWPDFGPDSTTNHQLGLGDARENNTKY